MIGVRADGRKELVALADGYRESTESWADLLRDCARRGMRAPVLAVGDGALGFWGALREVFPDTREQRCWFHKIGNVLVRAAEVRASRREEGPRGDLERRGPTARPRRGEGLRGRLRREVPQGRREDHRRSRRSCWRSTTSRPSTGSTCARRTRSSRPSPPSGTAPRSPKAPAHAPPAWRWRSSSSRPPRTAGGRSTHRTWSRSSAPAHASTTANSSNDPTNTHHPAAA